MIVIGELLDHEAPQDRRAESLSLALLDLADALRRLSRFELALDASRTALELAAANDRVAWRAHRDCGWAERTLGRFESAIAHYTACIHIGRSIRDPEPVFWGRRGIANLIADRGNLPRAERFYRRLVDWVCQIGRADLEAVCRDGYAIVLGLRGRLRDSLDQLNLALPLAVGIEQDRILGNIAVTHLHLGDLQRARALHLALTTSEDLYSALLARINLIDVYLKTREIAKLEAECRYLETHPLPTELEIDFNMTRGRARGVLGDHEDAMRCFRRAAALSHRFGYGRYVIEADRQIEALSQARPAMTDGSVGDTDVSGLPSGLAQDNQHSRFPRRILR